jgi:SAM-dependent methyltransferase
VSGAPRDELDEPLARSAGTAGALARELCAGAGDGGESCAWYHEAYPTLRLLGLAATPERHAAFYRAALGALAGRPGSARVLVSGAADTAMLAQVLRACRPQVLRASREPNARDAPLRIRVLDRCPTPLRLCRDYAEEIGVAIETQSLDLLSPAAREPAAEPFDLACTHSLLVLVPPQHRDALVAAWRALLRPGGRLVSTARIDPAPGPPRAGAEQADAFAARAREAAVALATTRREGSPDPDAVAALARRYAERLASWPVASERALAELLEAGGFAMERLEVTEVGGRVAAAAAGSGTARSARYAEFVALRR